MKNISIILNFILAIAVGILYYLHFSGHKKESMEIISAKGSAPTNIVYVNTDSLLKNFEYFKQIKKDLETKSKKAEADLVNRQAALQKELQTYQQNAGGMTTEQRQRTEEGLMKKDQDLRTYGQTLGTQLQEEQVKLNDDLYNKVAGYLKEHSKGKNYQLILGYSKTGNILYASDSIDVTDAVLRGLNSEYKAKK